jgi:Ca2+-binding EF-hand superfamily protein
MVEFDSGISRSVQLQKASWKILNAQYVEKAVKQAAREWANSRIKKTEEQLAKEAELAAARAQQGKLFKLREAKQRMMSSTFGGMLSGDGSNSMSSKDQQQEQESQLAVLRELFLTFDANGDGILDRDEFEELCFELGFRGTATQLDECWKEIDENEDSKIQFVEIRTFFLNDLVASVSASLLRNQLQSRILTYKEDMLLLKRLFQKGDRDKNGTIDFEEFEILSEKLGFEGTAVDLQESFDEIDLDGNGELDFEEFKKFFVSHEIDLGDATTMLKDLMVAQINVDKVDADTLRRLFARHDNDGNGYIDKFEFDVFAEELGYKGDIEELEDLFVQMDQDNNGLIDWEEFVAYLGSASQLGGDVAKNLRRNLFSKFDEALDLKALRKIFDKYDADSNGLIERREFDQAAKKLGFTGGNADLEESFLNADTDGDGEIDWAEFREWYKAKNPDAVVKFMKDAEEEAADSGVALRGLFKKYDGDQDGELSKKEFKKLAKGIGLQTKGSELTSMFRSMDVDNSGTIDYGEFRDWYQNHTDGSILKGRIKGAVGNDKKSLKKAGLIRTMFTRIDSNGSGEVEMEEMLQLSLDLGLDIVMRDMELIFQEMDLDGNGTIDLDEFTEWYQGKGGKGDQLRKRLQGWMKQLSQSGSMDGSQDTGITVGFDRGRSLLGTKRVEGKITYHFSRMSGNYSELCQFSQQLTEREKTGFSTMDKLIFLQQTQLFCNVRALMCLGGVFRAATTYTPCRQPRRSWVMVRR